jgi:NitT/TauT family transport system permease protein
MPHLWAIAQEFFEPVEVAGQSKDLWRQLLHAALFTSREAAVGLIAGTVFGVVLAFSFELIPNLGKALVPWILVSQTIPFVATAPMIVIWGGQRGWPAWISVSVISAYLAFFPIVINVRRGLASADSSRLELMRSYAAGRTSTLIRLKIPTSLPYFFSGLRLGATAAVVGAIVGELPSGQREGVARLLLTFTSFFGLAPERLFAAVAAAALLGLAFFGTIVAAERVVLGSRGQALS